MLRVVNITVLVLSWIVPLLSAPIASAETLPTLIFTEIKVRTDSTSLSDYDEFIEIYNASDQPIDLANYNLEYYNATNPPVSQQPVQKPLFNYLLDTNASLVLAKQPMQIANSKQSPFTSLSDSGGRLRLVTAEGDVIDEVAWTNVSSNATAEDIYPSIVYQCNSSTVLCNSNRIQSISRSQNTDGTVIVANPVWQLAVPSPNSNELLEYPSPDQDPDETQDPTKQPTAPETSITCEGMVISEILPNPNGSDTNKEFIELYNPTNEIINLKDCSLQTSSSTKKYALPDLSVNPGVYVSFSDSISGLVLPNSAGGTVWLLSPTEELSSITYPGGIEDDASWSLIDGIWQVSYVSTPAAQNLYMPIKPCPAGQTRNLDTNRCQTVVVVAAATAAPCKVGQERNPETGRCRSTATVASSLTPCKEGQERNPETNRCRTIPSDELEACAEGQERNPDTNRCRKVADGSGNTLAAVTDVKSPTKSNPRWWLAGVALVLALGYAVFEWRKDITLFVAKLSTRLKK